MDFDPRDGETFFQWGVGRGGLTSDLKWAGRRDSFLFLFFFFFFFFFRKNWVEGNLFQPPSPALPSLDPFCLFVPKMSVTMMIDSVKHSRKFGIERQFACYCKTQLSA